MAIAGNSAIQPLDPYSEQLATIPEYPRKGTPGDGTEPRGDQRALNDGILPPGKTIKDATPAMKFQTVEMLVRSQDRLAKNRWNIDRFFRGIRGGIPYGRLEKVPNQSVWTCKYPNGFKESTAATPNKADDLCNKVEDTLTADPVRLRPTGTESNDEALKEAAKFATDFLALDGGEAGTDDVKTHRWALNNAFTAATSILHYTVDRTGGGYQPYQVLAHPKATDPQNPLVALVDVPSNVPGMPPEQIEERATNPVRRYVSPPDEQFPAGQFVESADQADRVWVPKIKIERCRREQARVFPAKARIEDADAVVFIRDHTLAEARALWPKTVGKMSAEDLAGLASWRPALWELCVPYAFKGSMGDCMSGPSVDDVGSLSPLLQRRMFSYRIYVNASPEYQGGYWLDISGQGGGLVLDEGDLEYTVTVPVHGKITRCRSIPAVQWTPMLDVDGGDPMGWPFISRFAGASEAEATLYAAFMDMCDNMLHPHVFIPSVTEVDDEDWFDRTVPIIISPDSKGPFYETFGTLPPILPLTESLNKKQDVIAGLTGTAQGLDTAESQSGVAKNLAIRQSLVALSGFQQEYHNGATRGGRIKLQLVQAEFTTPMLMDFVDEGGSTETIWFTGERVNGIDRLGVQPGSGTMQTPEGKAQYTAFLQGQGWMTPDEAKEIAVPGIRADLGIPDNPFEQAIERSVGVYLQGPPEGFDQVWATYQQAKQAQMQSAQAFADQQIAAQSGMPSPVQVQPPGPPPVPPANPFPPRPNDGEPAVAAIYAKRLSKLFVSPEFTKFSPAWQQTASEAYERYMKALQPPPMAAPPPAKPRTGPQGQPAQPHAPKVPPMPVSAAPAPL